MFLRASRRYKWSRRSFPKLELALLVRKFGWFQFELFYSNQFCDTIPAERFQELWREFHLLVLPCMPMVTLFPVPYQPFREAELGRHVCLSWCAVERWLCESFIADLFETIRETMQCLRSNETTRVGGTHKRRCHPECMKGMYQTIQRTSDMEDTTTTWGTKTTQHGTTIQVGTPKEATLCQADRINKMLTDILDILVEWFRSLRGLWHLQYLYGKLKTCTDLDTEAPLLLGLHHRNGPMAMQPISIALTQVLVGVGA